MPDFDAMLMQLSDSMVEDIRTAAAFEQWRRRQIECRRETLQAAETPTQTEQPERGVEMSLYVLRRNEDERPLYDVNKGFVVRAGTSFRARMIASEHAGDEGPEVWRDVSRSTCKVLKEAGAEIVVLADFNAG